MFYKIIRGATADIYLEDGHGQDVDSNRVNIFIDTYFNYDALIEKFEIDDGKVVYRFLIERNCGEVDESDHEDKSDYMDELISEYMYVPEIYVEQIDLQSLKNNYSQIPFSLAI